MVNNNGFCLAALGQKIMDFVNLLCLLFLLFHVCHFHSNLINIFELFNGILPVLQSFNVLFVYEYPWVTTATDKETRRKNLHISKIFFIFCWERNVHVLFCVLPVTPARPSEPRIIRVFRSLTFWQDWKKIHTWGISIN